MKFRDMTQAQRLAWGAAEAATRLHDLSGLKSTAHYTAAQLAMRERRRAIGATSQQAATMVLEANRAARDATNDDDTKEAAA